MDVGDRATRSLLLTDVEGSTSLWREWPEAMDTAMQRHHEIVAKAVADHAGHLPRDQGEGDARFAAFPTMAEAIAAALAIQRALGAEDWPTPQPLRVRMGVHVGDLVSRDGNYFGDAVNRCARIRGLAHGGQVLLSAAAESIGRVRLPDRVTLHDLGEHRMKDLDRAERVYQLCHPDLPAEFPPLLSLDRARHNLPVQLTSFVGRHADLLALVSLVERERLVAITGFGGMGKTRLALQVGAELATGDGDGVFFVDLAAIRDPGLVLAEIASVLDVRETADGALAALCQHLADKRVLLILDNMEQVVAAGTDIAHLLEAAPRTHALITSREPLHIRGEHEYALQPLTLPGPGDSLRLDALDTYGAVELFISRARAAQHGFEVTNDTAAAVAAICVRLDGLPLAIELAAARIKLLPPKSLLDRLSGALGVLTGGSRDRPDRHQTLRATVAWSYDLLEPDEKRVFARLGVFAGGGDLAAAEEVCRDGLEPDVLNLLSSLGDKSLIALRHDDSGEPRFALLETVRSFALEQLDTDPADQARTCDRHAEHYCRAIERFTYQQLTTPEAVAYANRELDNIRAACDRLHATGRHEAEATLWGDAADPIWHHGHFAELYERGKRSLDCMPRPHEVAFGLLDVLAVIHMVREEDELAISLFRRAIDEARALDSACMAARAYIWTSTCELSLGRVAAAEDSLQHGLDLASASREPGGRNRQFHRDNVLCDGAAQLAAQARRRGDNETAERAARDCLERATTIGDRENQVRASLQLGRALLDQERLDEAMSMLESALLTVRSVGLGPYLSRVLNILATAALFRGQISEAEVVLKESIDSAEALGMEGHRANALGMLALIRAEHGDLSGALELVTRLALPHNPTFEPDHILRSVLEALTAGPDQRPRLLIASLRRAIEHNGARSAVAPCLRLLAADALGSGDPTRAARLLGAAAAHARAPGEPWLRLLAPGWEGTERATRDALDESQYQAAEADGAALALGDLPALVGSPGTDTENGTLPSI